MQVSFNDFCIFNQDSHKKAKERISGEAMTIRLMDEHLVIQISLDPNQRIIRAGNAGIIVKKDILEKIVSLVVFWL